MTMIFLAASLSSPQPRKKGLKVALSALAAGANNFGVVNINEKDGEGATTTTLVLIWTASAYLRDVVAALVEHDADKDKIIEALLRRRRVVPVPRAKSEAPGETEPPWRPPVAPVAVVAISDLLPFLLRGEGEKFTEIIERLMEKAIIGRG